MIIEFTKIPNGLSWNGENRTFTTQYLSNSYQIEGNDLANIELDNQVFVLCCKDSKIDGLEFSNIQDEISYIFGL